MGKKKVSLRERRIDATIAHVEGKIAYHKANVEIYSDVMESLVSERKEIAEYQDILEVANNIPK